jgi:hypothetical protein
MPRLALRKHGPEAVVLDLMNPVIPGGRLGRQDRCLRRYERRQACGGARHGLPYNGMTAGVEQAIDGTPTLHGMLEHKGC